MKISTKGRYALRMMLDLAYHRDDGFVSLKDIAKRQDISKKYLEQIVSLMRSPDMLTTSRGYNGGYRLARDPKDYSVAEILNMTEGGLAPVACLEEGAPPCPRAATCETLHVWQGLYDRMMDYLKSISLQDIIDRTRENAPLDFVI